jgi:hypothetical protein
MATIPSTEPQIVEAGDTVAWTRSAVPDYPGFPLNYSFQIPGSTAAPILIAATGTGPYSVSVANTVTALWPPGNYVWTAYVDNGTERHRVGTGIVTILDSPLVALGTTHASRTLALIEAAIEGRIPRGLDNYSIDGQMIAKMPIPDLVRLRSIYADWVKNETAQSRINRGLSNPRNSYARFRNPNRSRWPFMR